MTIILISPIVFQGSLGLTLSSNISEFLDFTLSSNGGYNSVSNSINQNQNTNYYTLNTRLRFKWVLFENLVLETTGTHRYYKGLSTAFNPGYFILNAGIGKKVFKNHLGEIKLSVVDMLNENQSLRRVVREIYIEDTETLSLQRFFMLNFTYNIRNFNGALPGRPMKRPGMREGVGPGLREGVGPGMREGMGPGERQGRDR